MAEVLKLYCNLIDKEDEGIIIKDGISTLIYLHNTWYNNDFQNILNALAIQKTKYDMKQFLIYED